MVTININGQERKKCNKISNDTKTVLFRMVEEEGKSIKDASAFLDIPYPNAKKLVKGFRDNYDNVGNFGRAGAPKKLNEDVLNKIESISQENASYTLKQMQDILFERHNIKLSISSVQNGLSSLLITTKKASPCLLRVNEEATLTKRADFASFFAREAPEDKNKCIFIDESGFNYHLRRFMGRSKKGTRAVIPIPTVRGRINTLIVAASSKGIIHHKIISTGTCNGEIFAIFITELILRMQNDVNLNGSWLILDNARIHGVQQVKNLVEQAGYRLVFLSPYSYMLNPIEQIFSKIKLCVRSKLASAIGTDVNLVLFINEAVLTVIPENCVNYVMNMLNNLSLAANRHIFQ